VTTLTAKEETYFIRSHLCPHGPRPARQSQSEHEDIFAALHDHDPERAARLALVHKRSVGESVSALVDEPATGDGTDGAAAAAREQPPAAS